MPAGPKVVITDSNLDSEADEYVLRGGRHHDTAPAGEDRQ